MYFEEGNIEKAKKMFELGANENNTYSQHMLGCIYHKNIKSFDDAKYWYDKAQSNKCVESIFNLGMINLELGDLDQARIYFIQGDKLDSNECKYILGWINYIKAINIYKRLSEIDYEDSKNIYNSIKELDLEIDKEKILYTEFKIEDNINYDSKYTPEYILHLDEYDTMKEEKLKDMIII